MILQMRIQRQKSEFQTASQSEIAFKMANRPKYGDFNFVVEYPTWVSIKTTLTGKLALAGQKIAVLRNALCWMVFGRFLLNRCSKSNSNQLAPT